MRNVAVKSTMVKSSTGENIPKKVLSCCRIIAWVRRVYASKKGNRVMHMKSEREKLGIKSKTSLRIVMEHDGRKDVQVVHLNEKSC